MDPISLMFYAVVCGCLSLAGPRLGAAPVRLGVGALVGVIAVSVLPVLRDILGLAQGYGLSSP